MLTIDRFLRNSLIGFWTTILGMKANNNWLYDEFQQIGKNYADKSEVEVYESSYAQFRDIRQESRDLINKLNLNAKSIIIDFGCGTGTFVIEAASVCQTVYAVDISIEMLAYARKRAHKQNLSNINFEHSGFLHFECEMSSIDCITSTYSFHHLPDFWKKVALERMFEMLNPDGKLYIKDVVIQEKDALRNIEYFINQQEQLGGDFLKEDALQHFREEFSTYDWIMESLFERTGFKIIEKEMEEGLLATYLCIKA